MSTVIEMPRFEPLSVSVAAEVRGLMGRHRVSQTALADALGLSQSQVSKRLRGVIPFDVNEIGFIADYFRVSVAALLGDHPTPDGPVGPVGLEPTTYGLKVRSSNH